VAYQVAGAEALGADSTEEGEVLWTFRSAQRTAEQWVAALENARRQAALDRPRRSLGAGLHDRVVRPVNRLVESAPPPPSRTNWTRLVPPPVLIGHVS
jgi:hypothetical protein